MFSFHLYGDGGRRFKFYMEQNCFVLAIANTTVIKSEILSGKFRLEDMCTSGHYIQEWFTKLNNYLFSLASVSKQIEFKHFKENWHMFFSEILVLFGSQIPVADNDIYIKINFNFTRVAFQAVAVIDSRSYATRRSIGCHRNHVDRPPQLYECLLHDEKKRTAQTLSQEEHDASTR
jgi:hypothetical protein